MWLFIQNTRFDVNVSVVTEVPKMSKTFISPNTVRKIHDDAFRYAHLESVVLNEGIEGLGDLQDEDGCYHEGPFHCSWIRQIVLPSMLRCWKIVFFRLSAS